jgi:hypothetical protein
MKYLKRFNESMDDYEDFLLSFFEKEPNFIDQGDKWLYVEYNQFLDASEPKVRTQVVYENLKKYLAGPRFTGKVTKIDLDYGDFYILIVDKDFYDDNIKVEDLNWEDHPMIDELRKTNMDLSAFGNIQYAKMVKGLPNNCSLIRGLNFSGGIEFWPQNSEPEPIYVKNNIELQYLLYKHTI